MTSTCLLSIELKSVAGRLVRLPLRLLAKSVVLPVLSGIYRGQRVQSVLEIHDEIYAIADKTESR